MNLLYFLPLHFPLLDLAIGPSFSGNISGDALDPATKVILIAVLVIFLAFVGYLIWKSLQRKD